MKPHDQLIEDYEDAVFALLMEQVAQIEGQELMEENERLKNDPTAAVPKSLDQKCYKAINRAFRKQKIQKLRKTGGTTFRIVEKMCVVSCAAAVLFGGVYAVSPQTQRVTLNFLVEISDVATGLTYADPDDQALGDVDSVTLAGYSIPNMPKGFNLVSSTSDSRSASQFFTNDQNASISIRVIHSDDAAIHNVDTENADVGDPININGFDGHIVKKEDRIQISLTDMEHHNFIDVIAINMDEEIVLTIAKGIKFISTSSAMLRIWTSFNCSRLETELFAFSMAFSILVRSNCTSSPFLFLINTLYCTLGLMSNFLFLLMLHVLPTRFSSGLRKNPY